MGWLEDWWDWFWGLGVGEQTGVLGAVIGGMALLWGIYTHFAKPSTSSSPVSRSINSSSATASNGSVAVVATGNVKIERDPLVAKAFETLSEQLEAKDQALAVSQRQEEAANEAPTDLRAVFIYSD